MAGTMVSASSGVMNSLLGKLTTLMGEEYGKLKGVRKEVASLEDEFRSMNALLEKLAGMDELDVQAKEWRNQVREMSYDIEDCIDDFMHHLGENDASSGVVKKIATLLKNLRARYQIANKIQGIKARVKEAAERRKRYKLDEYTPMSSYVPVDPRVIAMYADAAGLVGIDAPRDELVELLMGEGQELKQELKVASIVGFGGLGKTTVANEVYRKVGGQFDCRAFVSVSQKPDIPRLLNEVLSELGGQRSPHTGELDDFLKKIREHLQDKRGQCSPHTGELHDLLKNIREHLRDKRYFVIIDDLWDSSAWEIIKCAFPENNRGSRVLTTTRINSVAVACCSNSKKNIYDMRPLDEGNSRRLFFGRIFGSGEVCHDLFEDVSTDILKRCGGLPLAIISISSLLACQSMEKWEYLRKSLGSMFNGNPTLEDMKKILDLSYKNLPPHLKTCLLYVGMYPEDRTILKTDLVRQWIAEGFVNEIHGLDAEDVAESYFNELINRSMIQPVDTDYNDEVLSCRIHDIMLDLIRSKSTEENFIDVIDELQVARGAHKKIRRVSLQLRCYDGGEQVIPATISGSPSHVRSVVFFGRFFKTSFVEFKYVRVLYLDLPHREKVIDLTGMCRLFLLRYLKIVKHSYYFPEIKLPSHIGELRELETMDLGGVSISSRIPSDIVALPRLSHLIISDGRALPNGISRLTSLRTLGWVDLHNIKGLRELTNMRDLRLGCSFYEPSVVLATHMDNFSHFSKLKHLALDNFSLDAWSAPRHLRTLQLSNCLLSRIPKWIAQLHDLNSLDLVVRKVSSKEDGVGILAGLRSLVDLRLEIQECPEERVVISGTDGVFRALKSLMFSCPKSFLTFEAGAMPSLRRLALRFDFSFERIRRLKRRGRKCVPVGIEHLPAGLRQVTCVINSLMEFEDCSADKRDAARSALRSAFAAHLPAVDVIFKFKYFGCDTDSDDSS